MSRCYRMNVDPLRASERACSTSLEILMKFPLYMPVNIGASHVEFKTGGRATRSSDSLENSSSSGRWRGARAALIYLSDGRNVARLIAKCALLVSTTHGDNASSIPRR